MNNDNPGWWQRLFDPYTAKITKQLDRSQYYLDKGSALMEQGDFAGSVTLYDKCLALRERLVSQEGRYDLESALAQAYLYKGQALNSLGNLSGALALFDKCIALYQRQLSLKEQADEDKIALVQAYLCKANTLHKKGNLQDAVVLFRKSISSYELMVQQQGRSDLQPELATMYMKLGIVLEEQKNLTAAMTQYDRCIALRERLVQQEGRQELTGDLAQVQLHCANVHRKLCNRQQAQSLARPAMRLLEDEFRRTGRVDQQYMLEWARENLRDVLREDRS